MRGTAAAVRAINCLWQIQWAVSTYGGEVPGISVPAMHPKSIEAVYLCDFARLLDTIHRLPHPKELNHPFRRQ
jgi:hypothetical protein